MVLKLYGHPQSSASFRVEVILKEKNIPYELIKVDFDTGEHKSPEYMAKQPFGQIPCIDDDGFVLYESRAIGRYLCNKYSSQGIQLIPSGIQATALFEQMASVELESVHVPVTQILIQKYYNPRLFKKPTDEEIVSGNLEKLHSAFAVYEKVLSKHKYLTGDHVSLVDFFHVPCLALVEEVGLLLLENRPNVARWWKEMSSRPSWLAVNVNERA